MRRDFWACAVLGLVGVLAVCPAEAQVVKHTVAVTTDASGDSTDLTPTTSGHVVAVRYVPDGGSPLDTGADITITAQASGLPIITITNLGTSATQFYPRAATVDVAGAASLYAAAGEPVETRIPVADEAIQVVTANGGNALSGTFYLYIEGR